MRGKNKWFIIIAYIFMLRLCIAHLKRVEYIYYKLVTLFDHLLHNNRTSVIFSNKMENRSGTHFEMITIVSFVNSNLILCIQYIFYDQHFIVIGNIRICDLHQTPIFRCTIILFHCHRCTQLENSRGGFLPNFSGRV